ncbi:MAG: diaminopimelate epimerase [Planctomycetaceae bacterium]|nr:diaminopimelate epimerase [Planctomycetaceae bacterium]
MKFTKMHGCGNDYVYVNCFEETFPECPVEREKLVQRLSDRHFGIGGDGVIFICPSEKADAQMRMFNADGSESEMCGNGVRCVAKYVFDHKIAEKDELVIDTLAGLKVIRVMEKAPDGTAVRLRVDMGEPILELPKIPTTLTDGVNVPLEIKDANGNSAANFRVTPVSMGNPHCVTFVDEITDEMVFGFGPLMENHAVFPARANIEFIQVLSPTELKMRVWERGTGETFACGTGASAVCVAGVLTGNSERKVRIHLLGGDLDLEWDAETNHVFMTGPAVEVFSGEVF